MSNTRFWPRICRSICPLLRLLSLIMFDEKKRSLSLKTLSSQADPQIFIFNIPQREAFTQSQEKTIKLEMGHKKCS